MTDGVGAVTLSGSLPFLEAEDKERLAAFVREFISAMNSKTRRRFRGLINVDAVKTDIGEIKVLEVNVRIPGAHFMAAIMNVVQSDFLQILLKCQKGELESVKIDFANKCSLAVSCFPSYYPGATPALRQRVKIPKLLPKCVKCITTWVDEIEEDASCRVLDLMSSLGIVVQAVADQPSEARKLAYDFIQKSPLSALEYRPDIALEFSE